MIAPVVPDGLFLHLGIGDIGVCAHGALLSEKVSNVVISLAWSRGHFQAGGDEMLQPFIINGMP